MKSAPQQILGITSIIFNLCTLGQKQLGGYLSCCTEEKSGPVYLPCLRFYRVTLYLRILTSQMDVIAVFCIICSPIHVMLCKSEGEVDGCNLSGCLAYVYLRSSIVQKTKHRAGSQRVVSSGSATSSQWSRLQIASPPGLGSPGQGR